MLFDEGYLTDLRTAAAGAIAAKYLGPHKVTAIGIVGTGAQAYYQLRLLALVQPGTHITAVGADDIGKQELDMSVFEKADRVVVDSRTQSERIGDTAYALKKQVVSRDQVRELGEIILDQNYRRQNDSEITIADLTGIAIQDLQIATLAYQKLTSR